MDNAVEDYLKSIPEDNPELEWEFTEVGEFGEQGWSISYRHKSTKDNA